MTVYRKKQILAAALVVSLASTTLVVLAVRFLATAELFTNGSLGTLTDREFFEKPPISSRCWDAAQSKKNLTIHFVFQRPFVHFTGLVQIQDEKSRTLYHGPYASRITLEGLCYDADQPGGDEVDLHFQFITKHNSYFFDGPGKVPAFATSDVDVLLGLDQFGSFRVARMRPVRD